MNVAKLIASNFARFGKPVGVTSATLTKVTPGTRTPGAISAGTNPMTQSYSAQGFVSGYTAYEMQDTLIKAGDRKVVLFGASIQGGAVPEPNDRISINNEELIIVKDGVDRDPVAATYTCQCRR